MRDFVKREAEKFMTPEVIVAKVIIRVGESFDLIVGPRRYVNCRVDCVKEDEVIIIDGGHSIELVPRLVFEYMRPEKP